MQEQGEIPMKTILVTTPLIVPLCTVFPQVLFHYSGPYKSATKQHILIS